MRELLTFLTACAVLAIANAFTTALAIALLFAALMGAITYPRRMLAFAFVLGLIVLALKEPLACVGALGGIGIVALIVGYAFRRSVAPPPPPLLLTDQRRG